MCRRSRLASYDLPSPSSSSSLSSSTSSSAKSTKAPHNGSNYKHRDQDFNYRHLHESEYPCHLPFSNKHWASKLFNFLIIFTLIAIASAATISPRNASSSLLISPSPTFLPFVTSADIKTKITVITPTTAGPTATLRTESTTLVTMDNKLLPTEQVIGEHKDMVEEPSPPSILELLNLTEVMKSPPSNTSLEDLIWEYFRRVECEMPSIIPFLLNGSILIKPSDLDPNKPLNSRPAIHDLGRCPAYWDTITCWPMTPEGIIAYVRCPTTLNNIAYDSTKNASRKCLWHGAGWSKADYDDCQPFPLRESDILKGLWDGRDALTIYYIGYGLSLVALTIALWIFLYFKELRCVRNTIHTNLMITYVLNDLTWIITATLQSHPSPALSTVSCYSLIALTYFIGANFCWMLIEGLYLYILVVKTFSIELINIHNYMIIGYGLPALIVLVWAPIKYHFAISDDRLVPESCTWQTRNATDYIFVCPVLLVLLVNIFFLGKIMYVLITKLRAATTAESQQYRKAAKALLVLIPLLGVTYLLVIVTPPQRMAKMIFTYLQAALLSTQGFSVAVLYCFMNNEVRQSIVHHFERWKTIRTLRGGEYPVASRNATFAFRSNRYGEGMKLYRAPARRSMETSIGSRNSSLEGTGGSTCGNINCGQRFECHHRSSNHTNDGTDSGHVSNGTRSGSTQSGCNRSSSGTLTVPRSSCTSNTSVGSSLTSYISSQRKKSSESAIMEKLLNTAANGNGNHDGQSRAGSAGSTHSAHGNSNHGSAVSTSIMIGSKDRRGSRAGGMRRDNFNYTSVRREEIMY